MHFKRKLFISGILLLLIVCLGWLLPGNDRLIHLYDVVVFNPLQVVRGFLLNILPFSFGDLLYILGGAWLLATIINMVRYAVKFRVLKYMLAGAGIRLFNTVLCVYLYFIIGWGANYHKDPLGKSWDLGAKGDTVRLAEFDSLLVDRLNRLAPSYQSLSLREVSKTAAKNYQKYSDSRVGSFGLHIKTSMFSYFLERLAVEGYYNPFTGEGQVSSRLPAFMLPFVVSHEMAHQAGIAAEGDANLMAYAISTMTDDPSFNYSAALNVWLYVDRRLFRKDSTKSKQIAANLNKLTLSHMETLDSLSQLYDNDASRYSSEMFDSYLKMQHQKEGIRSYGSVTAMAWRLEQRRKKGREGVVHVP